MQINTGMERLYFFLIFFLFFFHISTCMWIFVAQLDNDELSWLNDAKYSKMTDYQLYIMSGYFVFTTISTVGYGDLHANTTLERLFCILIMLGGATSFTFISGALSSLLSNYDSSHASLQEKLLYLGKLRQQHNISDHLYFDIRKALQYDSKTNNVGLDSFISKLPINLRLELSEEIHKESFKKFEWFKRLGHQKFLAWVGSRLKQQLFTESSYYYQRGDIIDNFYFVMKGTGIFVCIDSNSEIFSIIEPFPQRKNLKKKR